jgi:hypothetical protein
MPAKLRGSGGRAPSYPFETRKSQYFTVRVEAHFGETSLWCRRPAAITIRQKLLPQPIVSKDIKHAGSRRLWHYPKRGLDVVPELCLGVEFLKCPELRDDPISVLDSRAPAPPDEDSSGNYQNPLGEVPGLPQRRCTFTGVFNDVNYVSEIDNFGRNLRNFGFPCWIPAIAVDSEFAKPNDIPPEAAAVIEHSVRGIEQTIS